MNRNIRVNYVQHPGTQVERRILNQLSGTLTLSGNFNLLDSIDFYAPRQYHIRTVNSHLILSSSVSDDTGRGSTIFVSGNIQLPSANNHNVGSIFFGGIPNSGSVGLRLFGGVVNDSIPSGFIDVMTTSSQEGLRFRVDTSNASTERMRIQAAGTIIVSGGLTVTGNLGVGVVPQTSARLAVWDAIGPMVHIRRDGSNEWFLRATAVGSNRLNFRHSTDTEANELLTLTTTGRVGVGLAVPAVKLHISGNDEILRLQGSTHCYMTFYPDGPATRKAYMGFGDTTDSKFYIANESGSGGHITLVAGAAANVGVSQQGDNFVPRNVLDVNGTIRVSSNDETWTTAGWGKGLLFPDQGYAIVWNVLAGANQWTRGIGSTSNGFYYNIRASHSGTGQPAVYDMVIDTAGKFGLGTSGSTTTSAKVEIGGNDGALLIPRLTTTQRDALTPSNGMLIYNTTTATFQGYSGSWGNLRGNA